MVQDANNTEGTGVWANLNAIREHVPSSSLTAAHYLRVASANASQRQSVNQSLGTLTPQVIVLDEAQRATFLEDLRRAVYATVLVCFIQGLDLLSLKSDREGWGVNLEEVLRIWRSGCIIKSDYITELFERHYSQHPNQHPLLGQEICREIKQCWYSLKRTVLRGVESDAHIPALGSSLDYLKYAGSVDLPTSFMEAQLDAFGAHGYELKGEPNIDMSKGKRHSNWSQ